jgi:hypothetical protein
MRDGRWRPHGRFGCRCGRRVFHDHHHECRDCTRTWKRRLPMIRPRRRKVRVGELAHHIRALRSARVPEASEVS